MSQWEMCIIDINQRMKHDKKNEIVKSWIGIILYWKKKINEKSKKICFCSSTSFAWDMIMTNGKEFFFKDNINLQ